MKLYPPIIEGTIPAFCGREIKVPFVMNSSVSEREIAAFSLKIKTVQSNWPPFDPITASIENWNKDNNIVTFTLPDSLNIGQFYKIQIAYIDQSEVVGHYSTVGIIKCISEPNVSILDPINGNTYTGIYSQFSNNESDIRDYSEKVYSYCFTLKDSNNNIIETSGEKLHNSSNDTQIYESIDSYTIVTELEPDKMYYLDYSIKTINGYTKTAQTKRIFKFSSIDSTLHTKLKCDLNFEDGYIDVQLVKPDDVKVEQYAVGSFYLLRASDEDNFKSWREILKFVLRGEQPARHLYKDMTIKQGVKYKYAIQQHNVYNLRSNKIESNIVSADFEYAFLFDGEKQLKIKYNPKISSFKNTLLESKIDTIGSKHPFIFRNGKVNYKEFPISGLISYLSDENYLFYDNSEFFNEKNLYRSETINNVFNLVTEWITENVYIKNKDQYYYRTENGYLLWEDYIYKNHFGNPNSYNDIVGVLSDAYKEGLIYYAKKMPEIKVRNASLTADNVFLERNFKLEVLEWLTNGQPKLFRSPTEGNYIVRLMNVSLSPTDTLGRMIHTFNCTAYEIADNTYENLEKYNFVKTKNFIATQLRWLSRDLSVGKIKNNENLLKFKASSIYLEDLMPGEKLSIKMIDGNEEIEQTIMIGATGRYIIDLGNNVEISAISFKNSNNDEEFYHQGMLTYAYYSDKFKDSFDTINSVESKLIPCQQFIGYHKNIIEEIELFNGRKDKIDSIGFIRFMLRSDNNEAYRFNHQYYEDIECLDPVDIVGLTDIYKINHLDLYRINKEEVTIDEVFNNYKNYWYYDGDHYITMNQYFYYYSQDYHFLNYDNYEDLPDDCKEVLNSIYNQDLICLPQKYISYTEWFDGYNNQSLGQECKSEDTKIIFNNSLSSAVDIKDTLFYELKQPKDITSIQIGAAIIAEICYSKKSIGYDIEENDNKVKEAKNIYQNQIENLEATFKYDDISRKELKLLQDNCRSWYELYIQALNQAIQNVEGGEGA